MGRVDKFDWTAARDKTLKAMWGHHTLGEIASAIDAPSNAAIARRARYHALPLLRGPNKGSGRPRTLPSDKRSTKGRRAYVRQPVIEGAPRGGGWQKMCVKHLRPLHVRGQVGESRWYDSCNQAFERAMRQMGAR